MIKFILGLLARKAKLANVLLLIASYIASQGANFLVQTLLLAKRELSLVSTYGLNVSMAQLGIIIVDAGSIIAISRQFVKTQVEGEAHETVWQIFWSLSFLRLAIAAIIVLGSAASGWCGIIGPVSIHFTLVAAPAFFMWAFNTAGFLDGMKLSGISGVAASIPNVVCAGALFLAYLVPSLDIGYVLGAAFSIGYFASVALQYSVLRATGWKVRFCLPGPREFSTVAKNGISLLAATLPGQVFFRAQLQICNVVLGPDATAIYLYIKQIFVAMAQFIGFTRRVEFPYLVEAISSAPSSALRLSMTKQKNGSVLSIVFTVLVFVGGLAVYEVVKSNVFSIVGLSIAIFSPIVLISSISLAFFQGLYALGKFKSATLAIFVATIAAGLSSMPLAGQFGLKGLLLSDGLLECVSVVLTAAFLMNQKEPR